MAEKPSPSAQTSACEGQSYPTAKHDSHALQVPLLSAHLNKPVVIFLVNGLRLTGKLKQFDQFTLVIEDPGPMLIFKHASTTITPARGVGA